MQAPLHHAGLQQVKAITFIEYASIPIRPLDCEFFEGSKNMHITDNSWDTRPMYPPPALKDGVTTIPFDKIQGLEAHAGAGEPFTSAFDVRNFREIHSAIQAIMLLRLHYCFRLRTFFQRWGKLQVHANGVKDVVPNKPDDVTQRYLAVDETEFTCGRTWKRIEIFMAEFIHVKEKWGSGKKLGMANWVCSDGAVVAKAKVGSDQTIPNTGSVMLTYILKWVMPVDKLERLSELTLSKDLKDLIPLGQIMSDTFAAYEHTKERLDEVPGANGAVYAAVAGTTNSETANAMVLSFPSALLAKNEVPFSSCHANHPED
ncbi:hypothetical protein FRB97_000722 [Tulasnella sp. 331]|nr:hypothetical protein FRB97_000722 [Tulasnella sp. 331]